MGILRFKPFFKHIYMHLLNEIFIYFFNLLNIEKFLISFALEIGLNDFNFQKRYNNKLNKKLLFHVKKIKNFMLKKGTDK